MAKRKRKHKGVPWIRYIQQPNHPIGAQQFKFDADTGPMKVWLSPDEWVQLNPTWIENAKASSLAFMFEFSDTDPI